MPLFKVNAYRIREIVKSESIVDGYHQVSFLIEDGPTGSDDVTITTDDDLPEVGDYWVNPFGDGHIVSKAVFQQTYQPLS